MRPNMQNYFLLLPGTPAKPFRVALGALLIKTIKGITDEAVVEELKENPYLQYLIGLKAYQYEAPFDASMMVHFRKRISTEMLQEINEKIVKVQLEQQKLEKKKNQKRKKPSDDDQNNSGTAAGSEEKSESAEEQETLKNGKLLLDATCAPADIRYPTDIALLNEAREKSEGIRCNASYF